MTVTMQVAVALSAVAVIVAVPAEIALTTPPSTVAIDESDVDHSTSAVAVAVKVCVAPTSSVIAVSLSIISSFFTQEQAVKIKDKHTATTVINHNLNFFTFSSSYFINNAVSSTYFSGISPFGIDMMQSSSYQPTT
jgi:hypothetical protein